MTIAEVTDSSSIKKFLGVQQEIYKDDKNFISPLHKDIEAVFDPKLNNYHKHGIIKRWIAINDNGDVTGRIAAFINYKKNKNPD